MLSGVCVCVLKYNLSFYELLLVIEVFLWIDKSAWVWIFNSQQLYN